MEKKRLTYIDFLEVVAVFFVIVYHSTMYSDDFMKDGSFLHYFRYYFNAILSTGVPLFFFANGYLLFRKKFDLRKHIAKMIKIVLQTIVWAVIIILFEQVLRNESLTLTEFAKVIWHWQPGWIGQLWFMGALICIYIFFPLLKNVYDTNFKLFVYFTIVCALLTFGNTMINSTGTVFAGLFLNQTSVFEDINFFSMFNPFRGIYGYTIVYFCVGGIVHHFKDRIEGISVKKRNMIAIAGICLSCLCLFALGVHFSNLQGSVWGIVWSGYDSIFTFFNVIFIYVLCLNWKKDVGLVRMISNNTLGIYYIQVFFVSLKSYAINHGFWEKFPVSNLTFTLIFSAFVLVACAAFCWLMKKCPVVSKLFK